MGISAGEFFEHGKPSPVSRQKAYAKKDAEKLWVRTDLRVHAIVL